MYGCNLYLRAVTKCAFGRQGASMYAQKALYALLRQHALAQLRFTSFAVINLRRDLHPQECAHAGRTKQRARRIFGPFYHGWWSTTHLRP